MVEVGKNPTRRVSEIEKVEKYKERLAKANVRVPKQINTLEGLLHYIGARKMVYLAKKTKLYNELGKIFDYLEAIDKVLNELTEEVKE